MAGSRFTNPFSVSIGNCNVEVEEGRFFCESVLNGIVLSGLNDARIRITATRNLPLVGHTTVLLNPKDGGSHMKFLRQEVLKMYMEELPTMNYAANTGKRSKFLERCLINGKYNTLILSSNSPRGSTQVIAAVTFQIIPADTQFAEIPLTAVASAYQRKGIGCMMYEELKERLRSVGVLTIFCWADKESEQFWLKQGFVSVGDVNGKGKARKLPVRADIRKALCFPGDAILMVAHLKNDNSAFVKSSQHNETCISSKSNLETSRWFNSGASKLSENGECYASKTLFVNEINQGDHGGNNTQHQQSKKEFFLSCTNKTRENKCHNDEIFNSSAQRGKRLVWEASISALNSKRVKGSHVLNHGVSPLKNYDPLHMEGNDVCIVKGSAQKSVDQINCPRIMFMDIADDDKRSKLTKIVEELGGSVTTSASSSTHLITGKARRTLNFCLSLCAGVWIVSPSWLKSSFREGMFLDESQYILEDEDYRLKYSCKLRDAVTRAKAYPHSLLRGYQVCLSKHIQPSINDLSSIILTAGGRVIRRLDCVAEPSRTIFLAGEEDVEEALLAAKMGIRTFGIDWLMNCVMRQQLDLDALQFAESL